MQVPRSVADWFSQQGGAGGQSESGTTWVECTNCGRVVTLDDLPTGNPGERVRFRCHSCYEPLVEALCPSDSGAGFFRLPHMSYWVMMT
jgi:hypothetical protein